MKLIGYLFFRLFAFLLAHTPWFLCRAKADFIAFLFGRLIKYRRKVVAENIRNSFPEKPETEINALVNGFYRHLADLIIEIIKVQALPFAKVKKHLQVENIELVNSLLDEGTGVMFVAGHLGNWEYMNMLPQYGLKHKYQAVYMRPKNKYFDKFLSATRFKYGCEPIPMEKLYARLMDDKKNGTIASTIMLADQSPHKNNIRYWRTFLNQPTPCLLGPDTIARRTGLAMVYVNISKTKRNHYCYRFELLSRDHSKLERNALIDIYMDALEKNIRQQPDMWLWSHKRWKHKPED